MNLMDHPAINNRVVTGVLLNGAPYSEEVPHAALEVGRGAIESLELFTKTAEDLSLHFMENGHYFVELLRQALPKIVDDFRLGDEMEANEHFLAFLESLHLIVRMLEETKISMGLSDDIQLGDKGSLKSFMESLGETLTNLIEAQERNDWVYLADILEYDLDNHLADLMEILPLMKKAGH